VEEQISLVQRGKVQPADFFLSEAEYLHRREAIVHIYINEERQEGKHCPDLTPREAFEKFHGDEPRIRLSSSCRHLLATHKMRVCSGRNGISFRFGKERFTYKSYETGKFRGEELIVWLSVGLTSRLNRSIYIAHFTGDRANTESKRLREWLRLCRAIGSRIHNRLSGKPRLTTELQR
jgi:hypothetical protein